MFSTIGFLNKELHTASNIKDRSNRQIVIQVLKKLIESINLSSKNVSNGLFCFFGLTNQDEMVCHLIEPVITNTIFLYRCDSKFYIDNALPFMKQEESNQYLILVDGHECIVYRHDGAGNFYLVKQSNACLVKRHNKGGSSSGRFQRIAEESRVHYIGNVVETINQHCRGGFDSWIFGSKELKTMVLESSKLLVPLHTKDIYYTFDKATFVSTNKTELVLLLSRRIKESERLDKACKQIIELLATDPDWLVFGDEIADQKCEYIVRICKQQTNDIKQNVEEYVLEIPKHSTYYAKLYNYKMIGKLYYKSSLPQDDLF